MTIKTAFQTTIMEIIPPTTETIITTVIRKTMEIFTKRMILMRVIRNTNQGGKPGHERVTVFCSSEDTLPSQSLFMPSSIYESELAKSLESIMEYSCQDFPSMLSLFFPIFKLAKTVRMAESRFPYFSPSPFSTLPWMSTKSHIIKLHKNEHNEQFLPFDFARGLLRETISNIVIKFG